MSVTRQWTPLYPAGSDNPADGDNEFVRLKEAIQQRMRNGGHNWETSAATDTTAGRHVCGEEFSETGAPALAGEWYVFATDGTTRIITVGDSTAATPSRIYAPTLNLTVNNALIGGTLTVTGAPTFTGNAIFNGTAEFNSTAQFDGTVTFNAAMTVTAAATFNSTCHIANLMRGTVVSINNTYSVAAGDTFILAAGAPAYTVSLPSAAANPGRLIFFAIRQGSGTEIITLDAAGADLINGAGSAGLRIQSGDAASAIIISDGVSAWYIFASRYIG